MKSEAKSNSNASFAGFSAIERDVDNGRKLGWLLVALTFGAICQFLCIDTQHMDKGLRYRDSTYIRPDNIV